MEHILYATLILLLFGLSLRVSLSLLYGARGPQVGDPIFQIVHVASSALTIVPMLVFIGFGTTWLSALLLMIAALAGLEFVLARRAMQRDSAWALLTATVGSRHSEVDTWQNHQSRFGGIVGRSFRNLVTALSQGVQLNTAVGRYRKAFPSEAQAYVAIDAILPLGEERSEEDTAMRYWSTADAHLTTAGQHLFQRYAYLMTVLIVLVSIVTFLALKIVPSYEAIFADFELQLPLVTRLLIAVCDFFNGYQVALFVFLPLTLLLIAGLCVVVFYLCDVPVLRPLTDRLFFSKHRSLILRMFAIAVERGQPFHELLMHLVEGEQRYPSKFAVGRLRRVRKAIGVGTDWKTALAAESIIAYEDLTMLETAQRAGNLPWVLRMLAEQKTRRMIFRWSVAEQIVFPLEIMALGLVVMFICVALFLPLVEMIHGLT